MDKKTFTKNCLATAFIELLEEKEYNEISIQNIVDKAGFSRMAYYRNFKDKNDIIQHFLVTYTEDFIKESKIDFLTLGAERFFILIFEHLGNEKTRHIYAILQKRGLLYFLYRQFLTFFNPKDIDEKRIYDHRFIAGGVFGVYLRWMHRGYKETPEELTQIVMRFLPNEMKVNRLD